MTTSISSSFWFLAVTVCVGAVLSTDSPQISQDVMANSNPHQTQKRSAPLEPVDSSFQPEDSSAFADEGSLFESPYDEMSKRGTLFRFGKRGSLFRFGKRGGSLFRFGKRGGTLFRFGRSGAQDDSYQNEASKRNNLFRFGKRSDLEDAQVLNVLRSYYAMPSYAMSDDVDSKRNVNSFHWGDSEK